MAHMAHDTIIIHDNHDLVLKGFLPRCHLLVRKPNLSDVGLRIDARDLHTSLQTEQSYKPKNRSRSRQALACNIVQHRQPWPSHFWNLSAISLQALLVVLICNRPPNCSVEASAKSLYCQRVCMLSCLFSELDGEVGRSLGKLVG